MEVMNTMNFRIIRQLLAFLQSVLELDRFLPFRLHFDPEINVIRSFIKLIGHLWC